MHGISYLTINPTHWLAKVFWSIVLVTSAVTCSIYIYNLAEIWSDSVTLINVIESPRPIWDIPFPAFTICPNVKAKVAKLNFTDVYHEITANNGSILKLSFDQ